MPPTRLKWPPWAWLLTFMIWICNPSSSYSCLPQDWSNWGIHYKSGSKQKKIWMAKKNWIGWPANRSRFVTKWPKRGHVHNLDSLKKNSGTKISLKKAQTHKKLNYDRHPMLIFYKKHNLARELFLLNKETHVEFFFEAVFKNQSVIAGICIFDTISASLRAVFHWFQ